MIRDKYLRGGTLGDGGRLVIGALTALLVITVFAACLRPSANSAPGVNKVENSTISAPSLKSGLSKICFTRGDFIYLKDLRSGNETKLVPGQSPEIAPDGKKVLFVSNEGAGSSRVRVMDLISKRVEELVPLSKLEAYDLTWSSDGSKIGFASSDAGPGTAFGVFNTLTGESKVITRSTELRVNENDGPFALSSWAPGDRSFLMHSLANLYEVSLDGKVVWQMPVNDLEIDSETRFSLSADRKLLLFDSTVDTNERPANQVMKVLDLRTKQLTTVTPDTIEARSPRWLPSSQEFLFSCVKRFDRKDRLSICKISLDGSNLSVLVVDANQASYSVE